MAVRTEGFCTKIQNGSSWNGVSTALFKLQMGPQTRVSDDRGARTVSFDNGWGTRAQIQRLLMTWIALTI